MTIGAGAIRQISPRAVVVRCEYCLGAFTPRRRGALTCSGACRQARAEALRVDEVLPPSVGRRDTWSRRRRDATGWGLMTCAESHAADLRVRRNVALLAVVVVILRTWGAG